MSSATATIRGGARTGVRVGGARHKRAGLLGAQARGGQRSPDAPAAHLVTLGLQLGPQAAGTVARRMPPKHFAHSHLPSWLASRRSPPLPSVVRTSRHAQCLPELAHGQVALTLGDVAVGAHRVGWLKMIKAFFKMSSSCSARFNWARSWRTSGSRATSTLPTSATSRACCQR
jgi:hypothetical protein